MVRRIDPAIAAASEKQGKSILSSLESRLTAYRPQALAILRIMTALLFMAHGTPSSSAFPTSA